MIDYSSHLTSKQRYLPTLNVLSAHFSFRFWLFRFGFWLFRFGFIIVLDLLVIVSFPFYRHFCFHFRFC